MTMHRRIILHVGSPKCGSTYVQNLLLQNASTLLEHNIRYPAPPIKGHPGNAANLSTFSKERLEFFFRDGVQTIILSHEDLYSCPQKGDVISKLCRDMGISLHVVVFIRPFSDFVFGDYSQFMKQFFNVYLKNKNPYEGKSFEEFCRRRVGKLTPAIYLNGWKKRATGPLILARHHDIKPTFVNLLGPDAIREWNVPANKANRSLRIEDCEQLAEALRSSSLSDEAKKAMLQQAYDNVDLPDAGRNMERIQYIEQLFANETEALKKHFNFDNSPPIG